MPEFVARRDGGWYDESNVDVYDAPGWENLLDVAGYLGGGVWNPEGPPAPLNVYGTATYGTGVYG